MEEALYAKIGRQQVLLEAQDAAYGQLLGVLAGVVSGQVDPSRVLVNLTARTWALAPDGFRPEVPPQVNGLPVVAVAPAAPEPAPPG